MPKDSHSSTRVAHRGPRHETDPDRRVKYTLRFRRKGEEVEPQVAIVRRHRRSEERQVAPAQRRLLARLSRRRDRRAEREALDEAAEEFNTSGEITDDRAR